MFSRKTFYETIKHSLFGGRLNASQVDGMEKILDFWYKYFPTGDLRHLCYMLATVFHETAGTMQPIKEYGSQTYLRGKKYYPYIGRGLVQLTWKENYALMSKILKQVYGMNIDLVNNPELAETWEVALPVMFEGMFRAESGRGDFTGKALEDYFSAKVNDPVNARRIINGTDKASKIAGDHNQFVNAIMASTTLG